LQIALLPAAVSDRAVLENLIQLYLYDLSEITGADVDEHGCFVYPLLDSYWTEAGRHAFLIRIDANPAGFALVNRYSRLLNPFDGHAVAEFFIIRKYRRMGIGRSAAIQLFDRFPGRWEVASIATNVPAHAFWRSTIDMYTGGRYHEVWLQDANWRGPVQSFVAPPDGES
jgi:predicted acetyltransferase